MQHLERDRAVCLVHGTGDLLVPLGLQPRGQVARERLEPASLVGCVAAGDDQADAAAGALSEVRRQLGDVPRVVLEAGVHRAHHRPVAQGEVADRDRLQQAGVLVHRVPPWASHVLAEPLDPELLLLDPAAQHQPGVEVLAGERGRVGELLALELLEVGLPGPVLGHQLLEVGEQRFPVAVRRPAHLHGDLGTHRGWRRGLRDPGRELGPTGGRHGVAALGAPRLSGTCGEPAVVLHPAEHLVDLLVRGSPEEADRAVEAPGQLDAGAGSLAERDEEGVLEGHGRSLAAWDRACATSCMIRRLGDLAAR